MPVNWLRSTTLPPDIKKRCCLVPRADLVKQNKVVLGDVNKLKKITKANFLQNIKKT